jgi:fucose 4-O-acetylase-like acetyltransferase
VTSTAPARPSERTRTRDPWLDNTKMTLVTLVVVGHFWGVLERTPLDEWMYDFLYFWHIPAFVLISGYLSRSMAWDRRHLVGLVTTLVVPYLIFEPALYFFRYALDDHEGGLLWLHPHWAMWYLPVLFFWRLFTPVLRLHWLWIPLSVVISLVGGLWDGQIFYFSRVLGLLPFFVLGLHLTPERLKRLDDPWVRVAAVGGMIGIALVAITTDTWARTAFLWYDAGYDELGEAVADAVPIRLAVMGVGLVGAISILALVPRRAGWYSRMGAATMVVYLFHGFFIKGAQALGWGSLTEVGPALGLTLTTLAAVGISLFLASPPVRTRLVWLADPINTWQRHRRRRRDEQQEA